MAARGSRGPSPELLAAAEQLAWAAGEDLPQDVRWSEERCSGFIAGWVAANGPMPPSQSGWGLAQDRRGGPARRGERFGAPPAPARAGSAHPAGGDVPDLVCRNPELWKPFVRFVDTRTVMPSPPTEKQLAYAHALAQDVGFQVPGKARENAMACSELISDLEAVRRPRPPTEKQLALAHELAQQAGIKVPDEVREDIAACREFIERLNAAREPRPTEKQLAFAQELAQLAGARAAGRHQGAGRGARGLRGLQ
ncbi:unnamed protein product [Prorocentrum cordatum]|uniref:Uncharacterized protein n=1 Tax=Prorocentrum cordatum TaxID=2364126 RepID=A0ABN9T1G4_9DINO|nr:unnamed protein product [Polarella glacialis]